MHKTIIIGSSLNDDIRRDLLHFLNQPECQILEISDFQDFCETVRTLENVYILFLDKIPSDIYQQILRNIDQIQLDLEKNSLAVGYITQQGNLIRSITRVFLGGEKRQRVYETRKSKQKYYRKNIA